MPVILSASQSSVTSDANGLASFVPTVGSFTGLLEVENPGFRRERQPRSRTWRKVFRKAPGETMPPQRTRGLELFPPQLAS